MEYKEIIEEVKENTSTFPGINPQVVGALVVIINELRELNANMEKISKRIQSDVI